MDAGSSPSLRRHYIEPDYGHLFYRSASSPWHLNQYIGPPLADSLCTRLALRLASTSTSVAVGGQLPGGRQADFLMQIDFLEHPAVDDVIVMSVVLEEVRHRNASVHQRLRALVDSPTKRFFVFVNEHHRCAPACLAHSQRRLYTRQ